MPVRKPRPRNAHSTETVSQAEKPKRNRADVAAKRAARRDLSETTVKACLLKHVRLDDAATKSELCKAIRMRVAAYSRRAHAASLGLLHLVQTAFDGVADEDVHAVAVPDVTDQTLVRQLMLGVEDAAEAYPAVRALHQAHPVLLAGTPRYAGDRNIYSAGAKLYLTAVKNHLRLNLERFLKRAVYGLAKTEQKTKDECTAIWTSITGWTPRGLPSVFPLSRSDAALVTMYRSVLGLTGAGDKLCKAWFGNAANLPRMLRCFILLNRLISRTPGGRPFAMLPVCAIKAHAIAVDSSVLGGLLTELKLARSAKPCSSFNDVSEALWRSTFHIARLEGRNSRFTGTVNTDGVSISLHRVRPRNEADATKKATVRFTPAPSDRVFGIDPGRRNIVLAVEVLADGKPKSYKLTRPQYYREAGITQAARRSANWNLTVSESLAALSTVSVKGAGMAGFAAFLAVYSTHAVALWIEYLKPRWANQRLRLYGGKQRVFARFYNQLAQPGRRTVVAYGAAKFAPGGQGELAVPTARAFKECAQRYATVLVDEFRTTKTQYQTGVVLDRVVKRVGDSQVEVRGLLWCSSTIPGKSKFVDRDLNAALNIRHCLVQSQRPQALTRQPGQARLVQRIGRVLRS